MTSFMNASLKKNAEEQFELAIKVRSRTMRNTLLFSLTIVFLTLKMKLKQKFNTKI